MFNVLALLIFILARIRPINATTTQEYVIFRNVSVPLTDGLATALDVVGGMNEFEIEVKSVVAYVSSLRNVPASLVEFAKLRSRGKLDHFFTEWIEGGTLHDRVFHPNFDGSFNAIRIPKSVVTSLAKFVYNLAICPIPTEEGKNQFQSLLTCVSQCENWHFTFWIRRRSRI
jgi:hypothetical protein